MKSVDFPHRRRPDLRGTRAVLLAWIACAACVAHSAGAAPATAPTNDVERWFLALASPDPDRREQARVSLMGITRDQLPLLERAVEAHLPVHPAQEAVLYDIVLHVHMAGEPYAVQENAGAFLGLRDMESWSDPPGVLVTTRIAGFCAYRMLREGDVIVGIEEMPGVKFETVTAFTNTMFPVRPGTTLTFLVLRHGQIRKVPIRLDARPAAAERLQPMEAMAQLEQHRQQRADQYWQTTFAPLVERDGVTSSRP